MVAQKKKSSLDVSSLVKAVKWFFCDRIVLFFIVLVVILLILTLTVYSKNLKSIKYKGLDYNSGGTACSRLLFKIATPALTVRVQLKRLPANPFLQRLVLYSLMFAVQIIVYGIVGKTASLMSSEWLVAGWICAGIVLLSLGFAYDIDPACDSVLDMVRGNPFKLFIIISNLLVSFAGQYLSFALAGSTLRSYVLFPFMFAFQALVYGFFGKVIANMFPRL